MEALLTTSRLMGTVNSKIQDLFGYLMILHKVQEFQVDITVSDVVRKINKFVRSFELVIVNCQK